jgi:DNA helicase HerA-like ATPase
LFEELPECGDADKPGMVFFFDEAHLLFKSAPKALLEKVEQVVRLIRSKGVGVYFITQNPLDVPDSVLGQLGNRIQHALRAYTPRDLRAVRAAAQTFRDNPDIDVEKAITEMGVGEALVSTLQEKGVPAIVDRCLIRPPTSRIGPATKAELMEVRQRSPVGNQYDDAINRESAAELLQERAAKAAKAAETLRKNQQRQAEKTAADKLKSKSKPRRSSNRQTRSEAFFKSMLRSAGTALGREGPKIIRSILGNWSCGG